MIEGKWDESFVREDFVYGTDAAEGEGRNEVHLAMLGHEITAYDILKVGLKNANTLAKTNNVSINTKQINLIDEDLPYESYDNAILIFGHVHKMIKQN